ncbi:MAG: malonyl-CoA decarboxylase family protein, partial [Hyphomicrobium sp.]
SLVDEPLVFVEVALMREIPDAIGQVLEEPHAEVDGGKPPTTAVFYSISNCQEGLKGISFGNFLLKQVVEDLAREKPSLKTFVTLSPAPQFTAWLERVAAGPADDPIGAEARSLIAAIRQSNWPNGDDTAAATDIETALLALAAQYFLHGKVKDGRPVDPVARFHLGNGARLERINYLADTSEKSLREACGLMVNYLYDPKEIERNHEAYANERAVACSRAVRSLLKLKSKVRAGPAAPQPALPAPEPEKASS